MAEPPPAPRLTRGPRPRKRKKIQFTNPNATRELPPIRWALSSSSGPLPDNNSLSASQDTFIINVSRQLEGNEHPECSKQSQDDGYIKLESSYPGSECEENDSDASDGGVSIFCEESDITAVQHAASASVTATVPAAVDSGNRPFTLETEATLKSRVGLVTRKLGRIYNRVARIQECDKELGRISAEATALCKDATKFGSSNDTERFIAHLLTLGEEKHAIGGIRQKTTERERRFQSGGKQRHNQSDRKGEHEARSSSNKMKVKNEGWTEDPKGVSNAYSNATLAALEASAKVKEETFIEEEDDFDSERKVGAKRVKIEE